MNFDYSNNSSNEQRSVVYQKRLNKCKCLTSLLSDTSNHRFLVGTFSLKGDNEVHLIDYNEEEEEVSCIGLFHHKHEIWNISSSSNQSIQKHLFFSVYNTGLNFKSTLWQIPNKTFENDFIDDEDDDIDIDDDFKDDDDDYDDDDDDEIGDKNKNKNKNKNKENENENENNKKNKKIQESNIDIEENKKKDDALIPLLDIEDDDKLLNVLWEPNGEIQNIISTHSSKIQQWDINHINSKRNKTNSHSIGRKLHSGKWDLHNSNLFTVSSSSKIIQLDLRQKSSKKGIFTIDNAHEQRVRDIEFNPYQQYIICSCGDDCLVKFWDIRKIEKTSSTSTSISKPLMSLCGHSHWVCNIKYNPSHDQLLLTSSTDCLVNLWDIPSIASKPLNLDDDDEDDYDDDDNEDDEDDDDDEFSEKNKKKLKKKNENNENNENNNNNNNNNNIENEDNDFLVESIDEHEDSVYSISWSTKNPWIFASASYGGRVLIHTTPSRIVQKILSI